jgi:tetratricopeptide (TPR) repeat protein
MKKYLKQTRLHANRGATESGKSFKNGANPKRLMNSCILFLIFFSLLGNNSFAQDKNEIDRLLVRAKAAYSMGNYNDALAEYRKVQQLMPQYPEIYKAIADVYEKLGGEEDLKEAMENYKTYLKLSPDAADKITVNEKIAVLEYKHEKLAEKNFILDDFSGVWITDVSMKRKGDRDSIPVMIFKIMEVGKEGKFRIEILPEGGFYRESIINKTVNVVPDDKHGLRFAFADAQAYIPSQSKYDFLRSLASAVPSTNNIYNSFATGFTNVINSVQESDLPNNRQTTYAFDVKYEDGVLKGYCNVIRNFANAKMTNNEDELFEITLMKNDEYYNWLSKGMTFGSFFGVTRGGSGKPLSRKEVKSRMALSHPKLWKQYNSGYNTMMTGGILMGIGLVGGIEIGVIFSLLKDDEYSNYEKVRSIAPYFIMAGAGLTVIGVPLMATGTKKQKKAINEYSRTYPQRSSSPKLSFGITSSGGVGLTLNF